VRSREAGGEVKRDRSEVKRMARLRSRGAGMKSRALSHYRGVFRGC